MSNKGRCLGIFCFFLLLLVNLGGCTHALHEYHVGDLEYIPQKAKTRKISAESEQFVVMGFVSETDYVNQAFTQLKNKCRSGRVTGIHTRYSTSHGFFSWTNKIKMTGVCTR